MGVGKKPAVIRELEGNRGKRPIPAELPTVGRPEPPEGLNEAQLERWHDIVASLPDEFLSRADVQTLERMAIAWTAFRETTALINKSGMLVKGIHGEVVRNPAWAIRRQATQEMQDCGNALGLSPLARTRLTAPEAEDQDPLTVLLGPHGKAWGDERIPAKN
jgi:P27 family predicted phage terminase small subunit